MRPQAGLTLLELLIALSIFSVMATVLFGGLSLGSRTWTAVVQGGREASAMATAHSFLRGRIEQLEGPSLSGTAHSLRFDAPALRAMATGEPLQYEIELAPLDGVSTLVLRWRSRSGATRNESWTTEPLVAHAERLTISYLEGGSHPAWVNSWSGRTDIPELIRIQVERPATQAAWPALTIRPLVTTGADCAFDAVLMDCRS
jgi:general secretion pathway protein J